MRSRTVKHQREREGQTVHAVEELFAAGPLRKRPTGGDDHGARHGYAQRRRQGDVGVRPVRDGGEGQGQERAAGRDVAAADARQEPAEGAAQHDLVAPRVARELQEAGARHQRGEAGPADGPGGVAVGRAGDARGLEPLEHAAQQEGGAEAHASGNCDDPNCCPSSPGEGHRHGEYAKVEDKVGHCKARLWDSHRPLLLLLQALRSALILGNASR
mmetsp:Transcript_79075/g.232166  ORF Transcript_79075/g.232166 Transcript_79075/m.232166 type:complete len:215 (+) Transcript_79075:886-1530(+)